jgi:regulator of protease activity HflC (stomatin/prohibitin superfamily)
MNWYVTSALAPYHKPRRHRVLAVLVVNEGQVGVLFRNGRLVETLQPGLHIRTGWRLRMEVLDTRAHEIAVPAQELLAADNVTIKLTLVAEQRVIDPAQAIRVAQSWQQYVYSGLQLGLREAVAKRTFDEVLRERPAIGTEVRMQAASAAATVGVELSSVAVRDVMLSGELRRAFAEAVRLREEGKAALEKARAEAAALRNLANAARMLKNNPDLLNVRVLQSIETVGTHAGNTLVLGAPFGLPCGDSDGVKSHKRTREG